MNNILKIYFYRMLGIIVGFGSMLFVLPWITSNQDEYAIYALSVSLCLFLTYGDLGFLAAGQKYCSEAVGRNSITEELTYLGFIIALLLSIFSLFLIGMLSLATNPSIIFSSIDEPLSLLASKMFITIAILMPIQVIFQRVIYLILSSRLKDYLFSRVDTFFNLLKIAMLPFFITNDGFLLFEYFLSSILISCFSCLIGFFIIKRYANFPILQIFRYIRFSSDVYHKIKLLAYSTTFSTIFFVLYYEFDLIIAAKFFSIEDVALYALAFTFLNFLRSLWVVGFSPFLPLMNLKYGASKIKEAQDISYKLFEITLPLFIILALILSKNIEIILLYWLGNDFDASGKLISILLYGIILVGLTNIGAHYATTFQKYRAIALLGIAPFLVYFFSFFYLINHFPEQGIANLAYAKAGGGITASIFCGALLVYEKVLDFKLILRTIFFLILGLLASLNMNGFFDLDYSLIEPNNLMLIYVLFALGMIIFANYIISLIIFRSSRRILFQLLSRLKSNFSFRS